MHSEDVKLLSDIFMLRIGFILLFPIFLSSKVITGVIWDKFSNIGVSYCLVVNKSNDSYTISSEMGKYSIEVFSSEDSILFSCLGYGNKVVLARDLRDTIYLERINVLLDEVEIKADYDFSGKEELLGYMNCVRKTMALLCFRENYYRLGVYIKTGENYPLLVKGITMDLLTIDSCNVLLRVSLANVDSSCMCPGKVLWSSYYGYNDFNNGFNKIIVEDSVIILRDIFIVVEPVVLGDCGLGKRNNIYVQACELKNKPYFISSVNGGKWFPFRRASHKGRYVVPRVGLYVVYPYIIKK